MAAVDKPWLFKKGISGNLKGRPKDVPDKRSLLQKRTHLSHLFINKSIEELPEVVDVVFKMAKEGNLRAIYLIFEYALSKPASTHIVEERQEGEEIDVGAIIHQTRNQLLAQLRDLITP